MDACFFKFHRSPLDLDDINMLVITSFALEAYRNKIINLYASGYLFIVLQSLF